MNTFLIFALVILGENSPENGAIVNQHEPEIFVFNEDRAKVNSRHEPHSARYAFYNYAGLGGTDKWAMLKGADISLIDKMTMMRAWLPESDFEIQKLKNMDSVKFWMAKMDKDGHLFLNKELKLLKESPQTDRSRGYIFSADNGEFRGRFYGRVDKQGKVIDFAVMKKGSNDIAEAHYLVKEGVWVAKADTLKSP
jgi:hypothetical protein